MKKWSKQDIINEIIAWILAILFILTMIHLM
jgi:hypothetical protein